MNCWPSNPLVYEINTWVWLHDLSRQEKKEITLASIPDRIWDELAGLKFDAVWFMGVWERSPAGIVISNRHPGNLSDFHRTLSDFVPADNVGSAYCVRQYTVDEHLGGSEGLQIARRALSRRGIRLILDFVPNHLAYDHPWVTEHPEFFIRGTEEDLKRDPTTFVKLGEMVFACGKDPNFPAWQDVLQVNAFNDGLRNAIHETILGIADQCDGVRCDMAMLLMNEIFSRTWGEWAGPQPVKDYWSDLIETVKTTYPHFLFIAEAYWDLEFQLQQQGFDFCYDKRLYDLLEQGNADGIRLHLKADPEFQSKLVRFIENHDEPRTLPLFHTEKTKAAAIAVATLPGARLFHEGQLDGREIRVPVFLRRRPWEMVHQDIKDFYEKILKIASAPVFYQGSWRLCECYGWSDNSSFQNLLAWAWKSEKEQFLVVINYSPYDAQGKVRVPFEEIEGFQWRLTDLLTGEVYDREGNEMTGQGLYAGLKAWGAHLLAFSRLE